MKLRVPRDRQGRFRPSLFAPYARRTVNLADPVVLLYSAGVSERKIGEIVGDLLGHRYSHAAVSRIAEVVQERVQAFRKRPLKSRCARDLLGGLFVNVLRPGAGIRKESVYVALGVTQVGRREVLGFDLFLQESARIWQSEVLQDRWEPGVREVLVFVTDDLPGMEEAIYRTFPGAD